jgi:hypothetical protein
MRRNELEFETQKNEFGDVCLLPMVDGVSFAELAKKHEEQKGYDPAGGYGGLSTDYWNFGGFKNYFLGNGRSPVSQNGNPIAVLVCECGETGCWPLKTTVSLTADTVTWSEFSQPHRDERDYSAFGPFQFDRVQYEAALNRLEELQSSS